MQSPPSISVVHAQYSGAAHRTANIGMDSTAGGIAPFNLLDSLLATARSERNDAEIRRIQLEYRGT